MKPLELALVGCGAVAQSGYLPALGRVPEVRCLWLVDRHRSLAERLARRWRIPAVATDLGTVLDRVEAVILAVPNALHAPMAIEALRRGRAVLCEKPLARTAEEVRRIVEASRVAGAVLAAGMIFRQYPGLQQIQRAFPRDALGGIQELRAGYGLPLDWPVSGLDFFDRERAGGGVLLDLGVHVLDALFWVLSSADAAVVGYQDDGESRVEAEARARVTLRLPAERRPVPGQLELSHLRRLENRITVVGERGSLLIPLSSAAVPTLARNGTATPLAPAAPPRTGADCFAEQIRAFARRVRGLEAPCAEGESQLPVLELIEACYGARQPLTFSWQNYAPWDRG